LKIAPKIYILQSMENSRSVIYPGTFDPITFGHLDIIKRCLNIFDRVIVAIADSPSGKKPLFSLEERVDLAQESIQSLGSQVQAESFQGLLVNYATSKGITTIIRGMRAISDYEFEFQMALTNRKMAPQIETIFMVPDEQYGYINSRSIKEICELGGPVNLFVPPPVEAQLKAKLGS